MGSVWRQVRNLLIATRFGTAWAIDLHSRAIVGWSASTCNDVGFVEPAVFMALWRRDHTDRPVLPGMIRHSDSRRQPVHLDPVHRNPCPARAFSFDQLGRWRV